ncbi:hypothetical protein BT96DRAFT_988707 [Gymnopus androsaceus JB14]|uniref:Uncharacterized protein n=1 Tax=Gymnopus androsaceus JB14 TaxID=1447944 RepID=A0A6A4I5H7_9AGAR|nr:hypothetical protein BT96DRAFT_988707 [Gymnopus androsaceus JB14]
MPPTPKKTSKRSASSSKSSATKKTDIIISIRKPHICNIVARTKNHEFRKYLISGNVQRMWFYVSAPDQTLRYVAVVSHGKVVGKIENEDGLGNADFNAGLKRDDAKFAYEIKELYKLHDPLPIATLSKSYSISPPQRYAYVPEALFNDIAWDQQERLF